MAQRETNTPDANGCRSLADLGRRKVVKGLVCGVTALAAYHTLPVKWGTPVIEQVFLPAHAATSGVQGNFSGTVVVVGNAFGQVEGEERPSLLATVSKEIGDFFVADAQANGFDGRLDWCVSISGTTASWFGVINVGPRAMTISGPVSETLHYPYPNIDIYLTILQTQADQIQVQVVVEYFGDTWTGTGWLARTTDSCSLPTEV